MMCVSVQRHLKSSQLDTLELSVTQGFMEESPQPPALSSPLSPSLFQHVDLKCNNPGCFPAWNLRCYRFYFLWVRFHTPYICVTDRLIIRPLNLVFAFAGSTHCHFPLCPEAYCSKPCPSYCPKHLLLTSLTLGWNYFLKVLRVYFSSLDFLSSPESFDSLH